MKPTTIAAIAAGAVLVAILIAVLVRPRSKASATASENEGTDSALAPVDTDAELEAVPSFDTAPMAADPGPPLDAPAPAPMAPVASIDSGVIDLTDRRHSPSGELDQLGAALASHFFGTTLSATATATAVEPTLADSLEAIRAAHSKGLIDDDEFEQLKQRIIAGDDGDDDGHLLQLHLLRASGALSNDEFSSFRQQMQHDA